MDHFFGRTEERGAIAFWVDSISRKEARRVYASKDRVLSCNVVVISLNKHTGS